MTKPYSSPEIKSFERLQVTDGLLINSDRWQLAHEYHRQRQNTQFQALFEPGIVCGLGVCPIAAPTEIPAKFRDGRWVQIQPGIAIDVFGNFIVVPQPLDFRIASEAIAGDTSTVFLVVSYVDPDKLKRSNTSNGNDLLVETFRVNEKTSPPSDAEIEVCRVTLQTGAVTLQIPKDLWNPTFSELDLRFRAAARSRPQAIVNVASLIDSDPTYDRVMTENLSCLLQSIPSLYPAIAASDSLGRIDGRAPFQPADLATYDLIYMTSQQSLKLIDLQMLTLKKYLEAGGTILIEASIKDTKLEELMGIQKELQDAIARLERSLKANLGEANYGSTDGDDLNSLNNELGSELSAIETELQEQIAVLTKTFKDYAEQLGTPLEENRKHSLRIQPFLFSGLPRVQGNPIRLLVGGGIVFVIGDLSSAWGNTDDLELPRETIRSAQELGINILHFAKQRHHLIQSMQKDPKYAPQEAPSTPSKRRLTNLFDKLT
ncbi:hypothetical protein V2H45_16660 [Tumidithrix elongata RA019]|uniref:DUF4159 domain-containing protein n=1 Tax=Tumidithrix elongata BACA0141 TaxID=2716417 RepID=A0AAW9PT73_9CYAN|nr:hypothetical protein [Tumidithrix elongata RA019]